MPESKPRVDGQGRVRELSGRSEKMATRARRIAIVVAQKVGVRGPREAPVEERITIGLSPAVVERFRATGDGCRTASMKPCRTG